MNTLKIEIYLDGSYNVESRNCENRIQQLTFLIDAITFFVKQANAGIQNVEYTTEGKDRIINELTEHSARVADLIAAIGTSIDNERENFIDAIEKERGFDFYKDSPLLDLSNHSTKENECLDLTKSIYATIHGDDDEKVNQVVSLLDEMRQTPVGDYSPELIQGLICEKENADYLPKFQKIIKGENQ